MILAMLGLPLFGQVSVDLIDVSVDAYPTTVSVPVVVSNPADNIGGMQFDITLNPAWISLTGITPYSTFPDFTGDFNPLDDASTRIVFYNGAGTGTIPAGSDTVMYLHFSGPNVLSAVIGMDLSNIIVSDGNGTVLSASGTGGQIQIGSVVNLSLTSDSADVNETVTLDLNLTNDGVVGGFQFDVFDTPDYLDITNVQLTTRTTGFTVDTSQVPSGMRFVVYSTTNDNVAPGMGAVLSIDFTIHYNAFESFVGVNLANVTVTDDIGGVYWVAGTDSGTVHVSPGYMEEPHNLEAVSGLDGQVPLMWDPPYGPIPLDFSEDFEEGVIPADWTMTTNSAVGWFVTQDGSSSFWPIPPHTWYACSNDDAADDDGSVDYLITPSINAGNAQDIFLNFESFYDGAYGQTAHIEVSTDGQNFTEVATLAANAEWVNETVDLSAYAGTPQLYIAFHSNDNGAWASGWAVDDITVSFGADGRIATNIHFDFNELGQWVITADKADVIAAYPNGIPYEWKVDWEHPLENATSVSRELSGFNLYRWEEGETPAIIQVFGSDVTEYVDTDVLNSHTYYYYVTSVYSPGGESMPSNTVTGTPLEWVELSIDDGAALSGTTDTLNIYLNNQTQIGFFYLEISDIPDYFLGESILETDRTTGWSLDVVELPSGNMAITGISLGTPIPSGDGAICRLVVRGFSEEEGTATVEFIAASIVDLANNEMPWTAEPGQFHVTIETQTLFFGSAAGNPGDMVTIPLVINSTQDVHGVQVFLVDVPDQVMGVTIAPTNYVDFSNWTIDATNTGGEFRILLFDNTLTNPIPPGTGHVADIYYSINTTAPPGTDVSFDFPTVVVSDVNNLPMHTAVVPPEIYIGAPEALFGFGNISGPDANNIVTFDITLANTAPVYVVDLELFDLPFNFTALNITPVGRFSSGTIDGISGENPDGSLGILAYEFATGITIGDGPILTVEGQVSEPEAILLYYGSVSGADINLQPVSSGKTGYGIISSTVGTDDVVELPAQYALYQNYPNPFNPTTQIQYDLKAEGLVSLIIYDLMGRQIKSLVHEVQPAGKRIVLWDATDNQNQQVAAGVYIYQLRTNEFTATQKMLLIK